MGPLDTSYASTLVKRAEALKLARCDFVGAKYGDDKKEEYRNAELYVLPSASENFGMSIAEALSHALPAIVTKGAPWSGLQEHDAGWWIDGDQETITATLDSALSEPQKNFVARGLGLSVGETGLRLGGDREADVIFV